MSRVAAIDATASRSLVERAMEMVRDHIRTHDLKVGDSLPGEGSFAVQMGVSRPVMREAFGALAALRLVDVGNGRRPRVAAIDGSAMAASLGHAINTAQVSLADVWDVRRTLELRTAELAALNRSDDQARVISAAAHRLAVDRDEGARTAADTEFHQVIAAASGNPLFYQIICSFEEMMARAVPRAWQERALPEERAESLTLHHEVADAIAAREPARARAAMERHFANSVGERLRDAR
ncbi:FadR/GntR family transcriptional regulator [Sphingopyxis sp. Root1497]|uniref:FadR/GntR family transcriptional regulator n=1 Tax=Sphingopyxis sp. Root1497 TaxID=1736474 RepID=UPI0009EB4AE7|nr:FCD domain-containing protein [Sphingopyxis sp. Root1497]